MTFDLSSSALVMKFCAKNTLDYWYLHCRRLSVSVHSSLSDEIEVFVS